MLATFFWQCARRRAAEASSEEPGTPPTGPSLIPFAGAACGLAVAHFVGPLVQLSFDAELAWAALAIGAAAIWGFWPWIGRGPLPAALPPLVLLALSVHLLASGGITIPGVASSYWIVLALGVNQTAGAYRAADRLPGKTPWGSIVAMAAAASLATGCYITAYGPVLRANAAMYRANDARDRDPRHVELALIEAAAADPLAYLPRQTLAEFDFERLEKKGDDPQAREQFAAELQALLRLRPQSAAAYRQAGQWALAVYQASGDRDFARQAREFYEKATELYPNSAATAADWALALAALHEADEARAAARRALALDALMPHADKRLGERLVERLQALESGSHPPDQTPDSR